MIDEIDYVANMPSFKIGIPNILAAEFHVFRYYNLLEFIVFSVVYFVNAVL